MITYTPASRCRVSAESLADAQVLFELSDCPFPGIYPAVAAESLALRSPLRVVQAPSSGFVQLGHVFDPSCYRKYLFAGAVSRGYTDYLRRFAQSVAQAFPRTATILEVGCGDGTLLGLIQEAGIGDVFGIDPGQPARQGAASLPIACGYFPADLPPAWRGKKCDLIITRHVLEHVETPREFVAGLAAHLRPDGQLWIEVPDLASTVRRQIWSNFYQIHCNYFEAPTLDALLAQTGLVCQGGEVVEIFGGSLVRRYQFGSAVAVPPATRWEGLAAQVADYRRKLEALAARLPEGSVGYGAAERTAVMLGFCPALGAKLRHLCDGNPLLTGTYFGGTALPIVAKRELFTTPPPAVLLFAISHVREIVAELKVHLPGSVLVAEAGGEFRFQPLAEFPSA